MTEGRPRVTYRDGLFKIFPIEIDDPAFTTDDPVEVAGWLHQNGYDHWFCDPSLWGNEHRRTRRIIRNEHKRLKD